MVRAYAQILSRHSCEYPDFFWAMSEILDQAKEVIMITGWWLTPKFYLRRPPAHYPEWRFDKVLLRKAQQGVRVYILVYKEVRAGSFHMQFVHS